MNTKFYITPNERIGFIFLILLIILGHLSSTTIDRIFGYSDKEKLKILEEILNQKTDIVNDSIFNDSKRYTIPLDSFNPNKADQEELTAYGISEYAANNLIKYRNAGGKIRNQEELFKIYGMDSTTIKAVEHLIEYSNKELLKAPIKGIIAKWEKTSSPKDILSDISTSTLSDFDPNTSTFQTLVLQGFSPFAANNLLKYIQTGGRINRDSDILKVYGVDTAMFKKVKPSIIISPIPGTKEAIELPSITMDSIKYKDNSAILVDINLANEEELAKINGIGPYLSKAIVDYRERLGGYYSIDQLKEIFALRPETFVKIQPDLILSGQTKKIYIPDLSFKEVLRHPYVNYETTKKLKNIPFAVFDEKIVELIEHGDIDRRLINYLQLTDPLLN